jgi:RNA polymerase sigma-70 factor (ECF subfamily)
MVLKLKDIGAFSELYNKYGPALYRLLLKLSPDATTAQRILRESFKAIWLNIGEYDSSKERLFSWMLRLTLQQCNRSIALPDDVLQHLMPVEPA